MTMKINLDPVTIIKAFVILAVILIVPYLLTSFIIWQFPINFAEWGALGRWYYVICEISLALLLSGMYFNRRWLFCF